MSNFSLKNKKILITGGSGFIGSYLLESFLEKNQVCVIDNEYRGSNISLTKKKFPKKFPKNVNFQNIDITNESELLQIFKKFKPEIVFHLAGIAGVSTVLNDPMRVIDVNLIGSYNLAKIIAKIDTVKKIIYASTSEVYGPTAYQLDEDSFTTQGTAYDPRWSYATSKLFAEHIFVALERQYGIKTVIGRFFNVYGPKQIGSGAIHEFVKRSIENKPLTIYDDGSQIRAWCYITDCLNGLQIITQKGSGIYNIGSPTEALTSVGLAKLVLEITKSKSKLIFKPLNSSDVRVRVPNIEKLSALGYSPKISLREGIAKTIDWYKSINS
jgi:UDP-glucuronate decarboxylase